ncbi:MAG: hypothetical protein HN855_15675 [Anaerolineae bacterium]|jgi:hypothetical protein|nr:hypothetical protein [Anaerolineae bacterium]MBT7070685.1 hypothetical protein [Anaerolineae bacterium]MBT7326595.1 hypothetical protein [Anaerolineae bacterium]
MQKKQGFIGYDWFKLIVAILLLIAIFFLWQSSVCCGAPEPDMPVVVEMEEVVAAEPEPTVAPAAEETLVDEAPAEVELPPFPEPNAGLEYDAAKGGLVNADGELVYRLNENGGGWTPVIPDEMAAMPLEGEWTLLSEDGNPAYTWDAESQSWVAVLAEETAAEAPAAVAECTTAAPSRLVVGEKAEVLRNVNFRAWPGISNNWLKTSTIGTQLKVTGEAVCVPHGDGAYLWWQLEREDGTLGWSAEATNSGQHYFLGPVE